MAKGPRIIRANDIDELAGSAIEFDLSAVCLSRQMAAAMEKSLAQGGKPFYTPTIIPSLVNSALAVELYFKCMLQHASNAFPAFHFLKDLFDLLDKRFQTSIQDFYDQLMAKQLADFPPVEPWASQHRANMLSLNALLVKMNNAFVDWRYYFEKAPKDRAFHDLNDLRLAARATFSEVKPSWENLIRQHGLLPKSSDW
ncbi:MAG: hypothetical protein ABSD28_19460 [Tepidisphaeraceae bacterium]|jgi:hypothetical protein